MSSVRSHFLVALASTNATMLINFVGSLFIARLLTPHEIGIFSVAYVFAGLLRTIREMGLGSYIVQESELTTARFRTAFGISIAVSIVTGGIVAGLAEFAARFYREPGIADALYVIAATFLLVPFGATTMSVLRREMRFKRIAMIETTSALLQTGSAVLFAWWGLGYMSLAWSTLLSSVCTVIIVASLRPPSLPWLPSLAEWRRVLRFSGFVSGSSLVSYFNVSASDLILGRMLNMQSVAIFNRARALSELLGPVLVGATHKVCLPVFSETVRNGGSLLPGFLRGTTFFNTVAIPVYACLTVLAEPAILTLYGPQWAGSTLPLQALCVASILAAPATLASQVMIAMGAVRTQFKIDVASLIIKVVFVVAAAPSGLNAVAWSYVASTVIGTLMRLIPLRRLCGLTWREMMKTTVHAILPMLASVLGTVAAVRMSPDTSWITVALGVAGAACGFLVATLAVDNPLRAELVQLRKGTKP